MLPPVPKITTRGRNGTPDPSFLSAEASHERHRSPGGVALRGLFSCPLNLADTPAGAAVATLRHTRAVRRWVCIIALLAGFSGSGYAWTARPRIPVPVERVLPTGVGRRAIPGPEWWLRA